MQRPIYLDYAATTPLDPAVLDAMLPYFGSPQASQSSLLTTNYSLPTILFGNPGSLHSFGQQASGAVFTARQMVAKELNCHYSEVIFTGSATEANNLALRGAVAARRETANNESRVKSRGSLATRHSRLAPRIIISAIEHESILSTAKDLRREGVEVVIIPVSKTGVVDLKKFKAALNDQTVLVSVMFANNEIGAVQPITEIAELVRAFRSSRSTHYSLQTTNYPLLHTDAAQAFQYIECDVQKLGVDLLTLSAHKIYGPKGVGCLYVRRDPAAKLPTTHYSLRSIITGGGQEQGLRSGTENVASVVGFAKAISLAAMNREDESLRIAKLRNLTWQGIKKIFPKAVLNGPASSTHYSLQTTNYPLRLPNNLNFYIPGVSGEQLLITLDLCGVAVSSGSACAARSIDPSHVLLAMGHDSARAKNSIRISLGRPTTPQEMKRFLTILAKVKKNIS